jgi:hypothetical protein
MTGDPGRLYAPSWINRFNAWSRSLPLSLWQFYTGFFVLWVMFELLAGYVAGFLPPPTIDLELLYNRFGGAVVSTAVLVFQSYLDTATGEALDRSRSLSPLTDDMFSALKYEFINIPAIPYFIFSLVAFGFGIWVGMFNEGIRQITPSTILVLVDWGLISVIFLGLLFHIVRLTGRIAAFYEGPLNLDLYDIIPVYELSGLSARVAVFAALVWYLNLPLNLNFTESPLLIAISMLISLLPLAIFYLPVRGMHRRLTLEKKRLLAEASKRLEAAFNRLDHDYDQGDLLGMRNMEAALSSLLMKRNLIESTPTWPWRPSTFSAVLTAVFLPVGIYVIQLLLDRLLTG